MYIIPRLEHERVEYIKKGILNRLGFPTINIELTVDQLETQIILQRTLYQRENPYMSVCIEDFIPGQENKYEVHIQDILNRNITGIKEIYRQDDNFHLFNSMYKPYFLIGNIQSMVETFSYYDIVKKVLRIDPEWTWDERNYTIRFYREFSVPSKILIFYFYFPLLEDISEADLMWILNYSVQEQKEILGRIRSKISSIQSTIGNIQLDGQALLSESQSEKTNLMEEMKSRHSHFIEPISIF